MSETVDLAIVGAGPCGLAAGIAASKAGLSSVIFDRSCVVSGIAGYPTYMTFFSTAERLSIGDVPFVVASDKPTRRDALAYYRALVRHFDLNVRQYEPVERIDDHAVRRLAPLEPDWFAVRGAACDGGRLGAVSADRVRHLRAVIGDASRATAS